jgi:RNA polymerase sigma factor (sigma-70 family)
MVDPAEAIYREQRDALLRFAWLLCDDLDLAEDVVAEAVAKSWPKLASGEVADPGKYLRRAVANTLTDRRRNNTARMRADESRAPRPIVWIDDAVTDRLALDNALDRLPAGQRAVVVCRFFESMSVAETAETLDLALGTVKSRMARAMTALQAAFTGASAGDNAESTRTESEGEAVDATD